MQWRLKTSPSVEPVSLAETKLYLKVEASVTDDDALITSLITSALRQAEEYTRRAFITQTWQLFLDRDELARAIELPRPALQSVVAVTYYDDADQEHEWASTNYRVDTHSEPGRILLAAGAAWPSGLRAEQSVLVEFTAGYGDATAIPEDIKTAIKMAVAHWYENREAQEMPAGARRLLDPYRVVML